MKIAETEVINKITREVLTLFGINDNVKIEHDLSDGIVTTQLNINGEKLTQYDMINPNEREGAEIHRLIKRNIYTIFVRDLKKELVPYGIMHGVRPTKIIHRWIRSMQDNFSSQDIVERIKNDYLVSEEKAKLLTEVAIKQIPILKKSTPQTISIYVGIPFCVTRCLYCSFPSNVLPSEKKIGEFMTALSKDIKSAKTDIDKYGFKVQNIYIGGGTPTSLPNIFFKQMLDEVYDSFYDEHLAEFTVECGRPDTITAEKILIMKSHNVNRVSVNPQSMQQRTLDRIGRRHSPEDIIRAFNELRLSGDWQINMDLILGLPGECVDDVEDSVEKVLSLNPDDITIHALAIKRGSRLQMSLDDEVNSISDFNLPSDNEVRKMSEVADRLIRNEHYEPYYLYRQGYISGQIENIGYCRDKAVGIYNVQIMDERQTIIGIGGAATTKVVDFKNNCLKSTFHAKDLITYIRDVDYYIDKRTSLLEEIISRN